jgi:hypothetical protein
LDTLAEEIRRGLAPLPNPAKPPALPLPSSITPQISSYLREKLALQRDLINRLEETRRSLPNDRVEVGRGTEGLGIYIVPGRTSSKSREEKVDEVRASLTSFNQQLSKRYVALAKKKESIRSEVVRSTGTPAGKQEKSIDILLKEFSVAFQLQEAWEQYNDYEIAVLQPGLSPEQRRLLFSTAIEKLDLPQPGGVM